MEDHNRYYRNCRDYSILVIGLESQRPSEVGASSCNTQSTFLKKKNYHIPCSDKKEETSPNKAVILIVCLHYTVIEDM